MARVKGPEERLREAHALAWNDLAVRDCMAFADSEKDPLVRSGMQRMLFYLLEMRNRGPMIEGGPEITE